MDLTDIKTIKELFLKYNTQPSKIMGQNFLKDKTTLKKIIEAARLTKEDVILEVGPGIGVLTKELAKKVQRVIAIEKDEKMVEILKETIKDFSNVDVKSGDILKINVQSNFDIQLLKKYKIVANIPYYLTSPLIRKFLEEKYQPELIVLMVQKEVAQRICSAPPNMNLLAVSVQFYAKAEIVSYVSKKCFWPSPKVDSGIIKITPKISGGEVDKDLFFKIVKAGFSQPRKQLANNLSKSLGKNLPAMPAHSGQAGKNEVSLWLSKNNINPQQRAETLIIQDWINLTNNIDSLK